MHVRSISLKDYPLPPFDNPSVLPPEAQQLYGLVLDAEALVLASPMVSRGVGHPLSAALKF